MKCLLSLILFTIMFIPVYAVPADGIVRSYGQKDGTTLTLRQCGDEYVHYFMTEDGFMVREGFDGGWYYAINNGDSLTQSDMLAHNPEIRNSNEQEFLISRYITDYDAGLVSALRKSHKQLVNVSNLRRAAKKSPGSPTSYKGSMKGLVILVNFADVEMSSATATADYDCMFNKLGYNENGHIGSVRDYFRDQSYGQFDLIFDVVGPVTVSRNYGYYGSDSMSGRNDMNVNEMVVEACELVDGYVNFKDYDWDGNNSVDQVFIIYAGYGQATGGVPKTIWPHESWLSDGPVLDGVRIDQYACSNELYGTLGSPRILMGIGCACHEFSHCLGLPDLYDVNESGNFGMGYWDVMDTGSYSGPNGIGEVPVGYSAFERSYVGWMDLEEISSPGSFVLPPLNDTPKAYMLRNDGTENEFLVLENHQPDKWFKYIDSYTDMHGMMVTHIDYDAGAWARNIVNGSSKHPRVSIIPADNSYGYYNELYKRYNASASEFRGDLFPGFQNITRISSSTHVNFGGTWFNLNSKKTYKFLQTIDNIKEGNGLITFTVGDMIIAPSSVTAEIVSSNIVKISWNESKGADSYVLEIAKVYSILPFKYETDIVNGITATSFEYTMSGINCKLYDIRVKSKNCFVSSDWSDVVRVVTTSDGVIDIEADTEQNRQIYDLRGNIIMRPTVPGIYLVKKRGKTTKIYIK